MKSAILCATLIIFSGGLAFGQTYEVLYSFQGENTDGAYPAGPLTLGSDGNLYGTTSDGGIVQSSVCGAGCGTVFRLSPNGDGSWTEAVLYDFCSSFNGQCLDGQDPQSELTIDAQGNIYGTTFTGGNQPCIDYEDGCGTVFRLSPNPKSPNGMWTETVLYDFCSNLANYVCLDGYLPVGRLATDTGGNLYGATLAGGKGHDPSIFGGIVFELSPGPTWSETVLYNFCTKGQGKNCTDGTGPGGGVTFDRLGNLYGVAGGGSQENRQGGIVYKLVPSSNGWIETLYSFPSGGDGDCASPTGEVSLGRSGEVYGTLFYGGNGFGCVFRLRSNGTFEGTVPVASRTGP